ncbi:MAG: DNA-processing protein DprA [Acidobacteriota bacterium]|nr:DNA-processing protein DprA [Acidobacteriota bacterium]
MKTSRALLIALNASPDLHRAVICRLAQELEAWITPGVTAETVSRRLAVPEKQARRALAVLPRAEAICRREETAAKTIGARLVTRVDDDYPAPLLDLHLPPAALYVQGELPAAPAVALVGSRKATEYGLEAAAFFGRSLAQAGLTVVSGFALGVDAAAHRGALNAAGGTTVAVLGCGLDVAYPRQHKELGEQIVTAGARVSEMPLGWLPRRWTFPIRNRIIAALARGTLVVQAARRSGSLITAHHALELGRDVWAIPGPIFEEKALGTNGLIRDGALLVQHPRDILDALGLSTPASSVTAPSPAGAQTTAPQLLPPQPATEDHRQPPKGLAGKLLQHLPTGTRRSPDDLCLLTDSAMDEVLGALLDLELQGWLRRLPGPVYGRVD